MTKDGLRAVILEEIAAIAPESAGMPIGDDDDLREVLDLDSMDIFNLVVALSTRLGVEISEADVGKLTTLRGGTDFLGTLVQ
ncbi:MAG TPA: acyl carrier protein [Paracoccaceae bacterium]|nr:acyl carrier protein [Paracoccaceae bacterium]